LNTAPGGGGGSVVSGGQDVYMNIYQNTNHPSLFVSVHYFTVCRALLRQLIKKEMGCFVVIYFFPHE